MGIVNAFINQIGREAARDVYRGTRSRAKLPTPEETFIPFNDSFLAEVRNFQIAATSSVTLNHLVNIVEKAENTNIENFASNSKIIYHNLHLHLQYHNKL